MHKKLKINNFNTFEDIEILQDVINEEEFDDNDDEFDEDGNLKELNFYK